MTHMHFFRNIWTRIINHNFQRPGRFFINNPFGADFSDFLDQEFFRNKHVYKTGTGDIVRLNKFIFWKVCDDFLSDFARCDFFTSFLKIYYREEK